METIRIPRIAHETCCRLRAQGKHIGLVPTMGSLHDGHLSLVKRARQDNHIVVASIFVNPAQFGKDEDFGSYPRDIEADREKLEKAGADMLFMPDSTAMYPGGFATEVSVKGLSELMCGAFRPGHFTGVATVVCKLLSIVRPERAYFGQKDYQQSVIIKRMITDLNLAVEMVVCPTVRETDGLAMSSRNAYLSAAQRAAAASLHRALKSGAQLVASHTHDPGAITERMVGILRNEPLISGIQYAGVYDPETLLQRTELGRQNLLAVAVKIGETRLIDNLLV